MNGMTQKIKRLPVVHLTVAVLVLNTYQDKATKKKIIYIKYC